MVTFYEEKDLVSFGEYLLSEQRKKSVTMGRDYVYHSDLENWKELTQTQPQENLSQKKEVPHEVAKED
jgi:tRNA A22 N-methylase